MLVSHTLLLPWSITFGYDIEVFRNDFEQSRFLHDYRPTVASDSKTP